MKVLEPSSFILAKARFLVFVNCSLTVLRAFLSSDASDFPVEVLSSSGLDLTFLSEGLAAEIPPFVISLILKVLVGPKV